MEINLLHCSRLVDPPLIFSVNLVPLLSSVVKGSSPSKQLIIQIN